MWNQAHGSALAGAGSSNGSLPRSVGVVNSPSTHRRVSGTSQAQHASSSSTSNAAFSRSFPNVVFPGTLSVPRSVAAPNSAPVPPKSIQHLSLLTTHTPASIVRLALPSQTTVHWHHLQYRKGGTQPATLQDDRPPDAATTAAASSDASLNSLQRWRSGILHVIASVHKSLSQPQPQTESKDGLQLVFADPLIHASSRASSRRGSVMHSSGDTSADLWVFVVVADQENETSAASASAAAAKDMTASEASQSSAGEMKTGAGPNEGTVQQKTISTSTSTIDSSSAHPFTPELANALTRLSELADTRSGSYRLAAATSNSVDAKGKQSSLTSEQRQAHESLMTSIKARLIDLVGTPPPPSSKSNHGRARLRLGECVAFLPSHRSNSDAAWFAAPGHRQPRLGNGVERVEATSVFTQLDVSLTETSLLVRASSRRIAALPLASNGYTKLATAQPRLSMLIAPLGHRVELVSTVPTDAIKPDLLAELRSIFARLHPAAVYGGPGDDSIFNSGLAICVLPTTCTTAQSSQTHSPPQDPKEPHDALFGAFPQSEFGDQDQPLPATDVTQAQVESPSHTRQFLWPAAWCLVLSGPALPSSRTTGARNRAKTDLETIQSQPMTPLKELAAFTLKVLNDANESASAPEPPPYTPGEPDDAPLARHRTDRLPSTRPDFTPSSVPLAEFDFAMSAPESVPSTHAPTATGQSVQGTSPYKRELAGTESGRAADSTEAFGHDLNWMQFLPAQSGEASTPGTASLANLPATTSAAAARLVQPPESSRGEARQPQIEHAGSNWSFATDSTSAARLQGRASAAAPLPASATSQSLLQPHVQMPSVGSTPHHGSETTPLGFTQSLTAKRKAGEGDIFDNMGLLTEDDFSFFDESAFGLDSGDTLARTLDQPAEASSHNLQFGQRENLDQVAPDTANQSLSTAAVVDDVAMEDIGHSSLDDLFSAIPGLQDVMDPSQSLQAQSAPSTTYFATSMAGAQAVRSHTGQPTAHEAKPMTAASSHPFHPGLSSYTPRDASGATPFGDPASLPGFTPSSLTESSPTFGNPQYKTPRTPYSPVEEYHDGATIIDLQNRNRTEEHGREIYREREFLSAQDPLTSGAQPLSEQKVAPCLNENQLRLADASTAAAAAANVAMDTDGSSRKRPAIVPNAFLPMTQPEARKPLQRLPASVRANIGRKYDLLGKFASRPKLSTLITPASTAKNALTTEPPPTSDTRNSTDRIDKKSASTASGRIGDLAARLGSTASRPSPPKTLSRRGQSLLQLRRDRNNKASPGSSSLQTRRSGSTRMPEGPATPRSSDDFAMPGPLSNSDNDCSSSDDDDSDAVLSDAEGTVTTLSLEEQATFKELTSDIIASHLCGMRPPSGIFCLPGTSAATDQFSGKRKLSQGPALLSSSLSQTMVAASRTDAAARSLQPTLKRSMLTRTANWLIQNPQFRSMYCVSDPKNRSWLDIAIGEKVEVLEAMASALNIGSSATLSTQASETRTAPILPTLRSLVKPLHHSTDSTDAGAVEVAEVLEPARIAVGCQGSVVETLPSALTLWDKSNLSAVSGQKHVIAKVLLTDASPAWHEEIIAWLERLGVAFESHGLGTHVGGAQSILAVADGSDSLPLSSYLDGLYRDGETWVDTLRSISSRIELDLLQGKHVVVYTLQPLHSESCVATGYHGLLRLEADLRALLSEQVGVLAEQLLVRPVSPAMMTESGSMGFNQRSHNLRRLALSVYDQLPRLVRRQPAKVLHGREAGPISAMVQFPAFSLSSHADLRSQASVATTGTAARTRFSLSWSQDAAAAVDDSRTLHVSYRVCPTGRHNEGAQTEDGGRAARRGDERAFLDASNMTTVGRSTDAEGPPPAIIVLSAIDERGGSSGVDAISIRDGDSSIEGCVERVWRFALAEASRARLHWRLAISCTGLMSQRELRAWQRLITAYSAMTAAEERVIDGVVLLSVRPDESGAVVTERGLRIKPSHEWAASTTTATVDKSGLVLLDAADFSQVIKFAEPMPMEWTEALRVSLSKDAEQGAEVEEEDTAKPIASAMLVHRPRQDLLGSGGNISLEGRTLTSHVLAVDLLQSWTASASQSTQTRGHEATTQEQAEEEEIMDAVLRSLHRLRLISEERHQLPWPYNAQPWPVASVNTLAAYMHGVVLVD